MPKSALVLSGGGALGAAHIGVWEKLEKQNYEFDFIAGVSAGALVGAVIAIGKSPEEAKKLIKETNIFTKLFDFSVKGVGLIRGEKVKKLFDSIFQDICFEDLKIPLFIGTTDFQTGERIMINKGKIADAVRCSVSVPVIFEPFFHPHYNNWLVDGGISQNFPLDTAIEHYKGDKIIGSDVAATFPKDVDFENPSMIAKPKYLRDMVQRTFRIIFKNQQNAFPKDNRVTIYRPDLREFTSFDITKLEQIIEAGRKAKIGV